MGMRSVTATTKAGGTANGTPSPASAANAARPTMMDTTMFPIMYAPTLSFSVWLVRWNRTLSSRMPAERRCRLAR